MWRIPYWRAERKCRREKKGAIRLLFVILILTQFVQEVFVRMRLIFFLAIALSAAGQTTDFLTWSYGVAQSQLGQRQAVISSIHTVQAPEQRKDYVRGKLLDIFGRLPVSNAPLNARVTNRISQAGFQIETVIFESSTGYFVSADVYVPSAPGVYPAVLDQVGHYSNSKAEEQLAASNLALKGFVVLVFDPVGQGERLQGENFVAPPADPGVYQHLMAGAQTILVGKTLARYMVSDAMRALDYLNSRPDVDSHRIGATGCSGGGVLTEWTAALDARIKVVAAACSLNVSSNIFPSPGDSEQSPQDLIGAGLDYADFVEVVAPEPYLILTTAGDDPAAPQAAFNEAQSFYKVYGASNNVQFFEGPGPHGEPIQVREAIYAWMIQWLGGGRTDSTEVEVSLLPDASLNATTTGVVGGLEIYQLLAGEVQREPVTGTPQDMTSFILNLMPPGGFQPVAASPEVSDGGTYWIESFTFETEPGLSCAARLLVPKANGPNPAVIYVNTNSLGSAAANALASQGYEVLDLLPRAVPSDIGADYYYTDWTPNVQAQLIGGNLTAMRAYDIRQALHLLQARPEVDKSRISGQAFSVGGIWLLLAAAVENGLSALQLDRTPYSLRAGLSVPVHYDLFAAALQGFAVKWDLSNLVSALGKRPITWTNPTDWLRNLVPVSAVTPPLTATLSNRSVGPGPYYVDLQLNNSGPAMAIGVSVTTITVKTLTGTGAISATSALPLTIGDLVAGGSATIRVFLNVPASVTRFSISETLAYRSSTGQPLIVELSQTMAH